MSSPAVQRAARRPGRRPACPEDIVIRVVDMRRQGLSYAQIRDVLNAEGIPTPLSRARWLKSSVDRLLHTRHAMELQEQRMSVPGAGSGEGAAPGTAYG